jgi:cob(I)alamin adenosyltransferase
MRSTLRLPTTHKGVDTVEPRGLVQVYTGDGKGKTTAAFGLALRAAGQGLRVCIIQFLKSPRLRAGEHQAIRKVPGVAVFKFGGAFVLSETDGKVLEEAHKSCAEAMSLTRRKLMEKNLDVLILDEIIVAVSFGLVDLSDVLSLISSRPPHLEMVLTGRGAPLELIEVADLVTEMRALKHPFDKGVGARKGIEF